MGRKRTSVIWSISDEEFVKLVKKSKRWKDLFEYFGMKNIGANHKTIKKRINELNLDTSHFLIRTASSHFSRTLSEEEFKEKWLTKKSDKNRTQLKKYLIQFDIIEYRCKYCKNIGSWMGKEISLQLDHINGIGDDNRVVNLRFLCPNCHSQTETFAGKNVKPRIRKCSSCDSHISKGSNCCRKCHHKNQSKIIWPSQDQLEKLVWEKPIIHIAKDLGVSDTAINKKCKKLNIKTPPQGYWLRK